MVEPPRPAGRRAGVHGGRGGGLALTLQQWIWGASVQQGLPERPLVWCLLWAGGIGLLLSLLQRQRQAAACLR